MALRHNMTHHTTATSIAGRQVIKTQQHNSTWSACTLYNRKAKTLGIWEIATTAAVVVAAVATAAVTAAVAAPPVMPYPSIILIYCCYLPSKPDSALAHKRLYMLTTKRTNLLRETRAKNRYFWKLRKSSKAHNPAKSTTQPRGPQSNMPFYSIDPFQLLASVFSAVSTGHAIAVHEPSLRIARGLTICP